MRVQIPAPEWLRESSLHGRWALIIQVLSERGWKVVKRGRPYLLPKGLSMAVHPLRRIRLRPTADTKNPTRDEVALLAHETCHVLQGGGSRIWWPLRYLLDPWFRRAVEEEAYAHGVALLLSVGAAWATTDPAVLRPSVYWLRRDLGTADRVHARACDLVDSARGGA